MGAVVRINLGTFPPMAEDVPEESMQRAAANLAAELP